MNMVDFIVKLKDFQKAYEYEENLLPFHFNVIDELHANENAHSRILQKILLYKRQNKYPFLLSFLEKKLATLGSITTPKIVINDNDTLIILCDCS